VKCRQVRGTRRVARAARDAAKETSKELEEFKRQHQHDIDEIRAVIKARITKPVQQVITLRLAVAAQALSMGTSQGMQTDIRFLPMPLALRPSWTSCGLESSTKTQKEISSRRWSEMPWIDFHRPGRTWSNISELAREPLEQCWCWTSLSLLTPTGTFSGHGMGLSLKSNMGSWSSGATQAKYKVQGSGI